jgi:N6-adenosine-specific RNA methylase IME4
MTICFVANSSADGDSAWARRIAEAWNATRDSVIECGRLLIEAKNALPHGAWQRMIETTLPFSASTAQRLMKIAGDERLTNPAHAPQLPPSWATLYELSQLDDGTFSHAVTKGLIRPDMERKDAERLRTGKRRAERLARIEALSARNAPLPVAASGEVERQSGKMTRRRYPVIYADPPWRFETYSPKGQDNTPDAHYPTMTMAEIAALDVAHLAADDAVLFLWATVPHLCVALHVMASWGFDYRSHQIWAKTEADGSPHRGMGYWFVNCHELLLVGVRGGMPAPIMGAQELSLIEHQVGRHSEKPARFRVMIDRLYPGVGKIELFARQAVTGWERWGNEANDGDGK